VFEGDFMKKLNLLTAVLMLCCSTAFAGGSTTVGVPAPQFVVACEGRGDLEVSVVGQSSPWKLTVISQREQYLVSNAAVIANPVPGMMGAPRKYESSTHELQVQLDGTPKFDADGNRLAPGTLIYKDSGRTEGLSCTVFKSKN
jgi:hypothetical protein